MIPRSQNRPGTHAGRRTTNWASSLPERQQDEHDKLDCSQLDSEAAMMPLTEFFQDDTAVRQVISVLIFNFRPRSCRYRPHCRVDRYPPFLIDSDPISRWTRHSRSPSTTVRSVYRQISHRLRLATDWGRGEGRKGGIPPPVQVLLDQTAAPDSACAIR